MFFDPLGKASMGAVLVLVRSILDEFWRSIGKYLEQRVGNKMIDGTTKSGNLFDQTTT